MNDELDQLAFSFFKLFAKYESWLKGNGYFQEVNGGKIVVDWDRFVNERIGSNFLEKLGNKAGSAEYILNQPPKKQVVQDSVIVWGDIPNNERSVQILFSHISRMRNNLYHGAKFNGTWFDPERSMELLSHGLVILKHFKDTANVH